MTLREMGAADNLPWHLEHMGLHGPKWKLRSMKSPESICISKSETKVDIKERNIVLKFHDMESTIQ